MDVVGGVRPDLIYVNCKSVANFGSFEYWFALIKVAAIMAFIVIGLAHVFGIGTGRPPVGMHNPTGLEAVSCRTAWAACGWAC